MNLKIVGSAAILACWRVTVIIVDSVYIDKFGGLPGTLAKEFLSGGRFHQTSTITNRMAWDT